MKKHKAWAQCSGVRNPAEYRKRADLATPSSIDKDFNFITTVERSVARADEGISDRGIILAPARQLKGKETRPKWETEAKQRGITIIKAPKGLSRSKQTKTHWNNQQKCIIWTIEWICADGGKVLTQCHETKSVAEAFLQTVGKKALKRKRTSFKASGMPDPKLQKHSLDYHSHDPLENGPAAEDNSVGDRVSPPAALEQPLADFHFYLHKPNTPSNLKCLIPVSEDQLLRDIVDGRVLIDFPTIFVKYESPEQLCLPYITYAEFQRRHGTSGAAAVTIEQLEDGEVDEPESTMTVPKDVDTKKVLEVLAQDLAG